MSPPSFIRTEKEGMELYGEPRRLVWFVKGGTPVPRANRDLDIDEQDYVTEMRERYPPLEVI
jgi:hypothetical protein